MQKATYLEYLPLDFETRSDLSSALRSLDRARSARHRFNKAEASNDTTSRPNSSSSLFTLNPDEEIMSDEEDEREAVVSNSLSEPVKVDDSR